MDSWSARGAILAIMQSLVLVASALLALAAPPAQDRPLSGAQDEARYRCGDQWFDEADANDYHSRLLRWWRLEGEGFVALTTCSRRTGRIALRWMESTRPDLERLFGASPPVATVIVLRSQVQYNAFALTEKEPDRVPPESRGFSAFHHAFACDSWLDLDRDREAPGAACAYWDDRTDAGNQWGPLAVRHAAALAFVEALDPSPSATAAYRASPALDFDSAVFWAEKNLPAWLRYGAAVYCERYFLERGVANPAWARTWSLQELERLGGLGNLEEALECALHPTAVARSQRLLLQAGLLVAYLLDGEDATLRRPHAELRRALEEGQGIREAVAGLEAAMRRSEAELRAFADAN